jgi:hypothetical protein
LSKTTSELERVIRGFFFTPTTEPKKQQFIQAHLSQANDLYQLYAHKIKNMKQNSLKKIVNRLRLCILAFVLTLLSLLIFSISAGHF